VIHRDLKPDNLFLVARPHTPAEAVKVLDFGIAKLGEPWKLAGSMKTRSGMVMGTPVYMSPELCSGARQVDQRTDIYSLGVILYEMLCGQPPFLSDGFGELAHLHLSATPASPRQRNPLLSESLEALVLRALAKDPAQRFGSMSELRDGLLAGGGRRSGGWAVTTDVVRPTAPAARRRRALLALLGAAAAVAAAGLGLRRLRSPPKKPSAPVPRSSIPAASGPAALPAQAPPARPAPPAELTRPERERPRRSSGTRKRADPPTAPARRRREPTPL
jgi:serine/threonine protein kinase